MNRFLIILNVFNLVPILTTATCALENSFKKKNHHLQN